MSTLDVIRRALRKRRANQNEQDAFLMRLEDIGRERQGIINVVERDRAEEKSAAEVDILDRTHNFAH